MTIALAACQKAAPPAPEPRTVVAFTVIPARPAVSRLAAVVQARFTTPLAFRVGGLLVERRVYVGDTVKRGQALARLDDADARKNATAAQAAAQAAAHRLSFAQAQRVRDDAQAKEDLISKVQLEQTHDAYASALAQDDQARQQAALSADQLRYQTLIADHDGVVTEERADTGQVVSAGQAVYTIAWSGARDVVADIAENTVGDLAVGRHVRVIIPALPGREFGATIREIAPAADPQSRTYRVKAALDHDDAAVRLGMTAELAVAGNPPPVSPKAGAAPAPEPVSVPATALFHKGQDTAVWVIQADHTLVLRPVSVSRFDERMIVISKGLEPGEQVLAKGVQAVTEGEKVQSVTAQGAAS
jgi:RND family efflux transporter MFP subunit